MEHGEGEHRHRLLDGIAGRVIEIGAGDGVNFAYYPDAVIRVLAVEPAIIPVWSRLGGGCHLNRDNEGEITRAGFQIKRIARFVFAPSPLERLGGDIILGVATAAKRPGHIT